MRWLLTICMLLGMSLTAHAVGIYVVDGEGGGDFRSVQECFDALPSKPTEWRMVYIRAGEYREKVTLDVYKDKLFIIGESDSSKGVTRIVWDDHTGRVVNGHEMTTYDTWTMSIQADDVYVANLVIENDAPLGEGQAVALETRGDRIWIDNCRLIGNQDTFFTKDYVARLYITDCYVEGTTDFIFGASIALFENCHIHAKANSYITAASTTERNKYGYVFRNCRVTASPSVTRLYLGRPWKSTARTVWMECNFDAPIDGAGWRDWHDSARKGGVFYAEYRCTGRGADRSDRVEWSRELADDEARDYSIENIYYKKTGSEQFYDSWLPTREMLSEAGLDTMLKRIKKEIEKR